MNLWKTRRLPRSTLGATGLIFRSEAAIVSGEAATGLTISQTQLRYEKKKTLW